MNEDHVNTERESRSVLNIHVFKGRGPLRFPASITSQLKNLDNRRDLGLGVAVVVATAASIASAVAGSKTAAVPDGLVGMLVEPWVVAWGDAAGIVAPATDLAAAE